MASLLDIVALMRAGRWDEAHTLVQQDPSETAAWLHGLVHVEEGDLGNAEYWYRRAGRPFRSRGSIAQELDLVETQLRAG